MALFTSESTNFESQANEEDNFALVCIGAG